MKHLVIWSRWFGGALYRFGDVFVSWIVIVDRVRRYWWARNQSKRFVREAQGAFLERRPEEALHICEKRRASHLARVVRAGVQELCSHHVSAFPSELTRLAES
jgi:hypothetical protein